MVCLRHSNEVATKERVQDSHSRIFDRLMSQYEATGMVGGVRPRDKKHAIQLARKHSRK